MDDSARDPQQVEVAIVGTGFAGLGMAAALRRAGRRDFVVLEKAADVGGTWRDNHYPGCACDVPSHLYSFSFAPNPAWTRMYSPQPEIRAYLRGLAERLDLLPQIRFNSEIVEARWDAASSTWQLKARDGHRVAARALVLGAGGLSRPAYPVLPGLENFQGRRFHSQDWNHDYDLAGKRVAVIGTGASAIQFVPQIQKSAARVDLYQRTPPWIMPKPDRPITRFERWLFRALPFTQKLYRAAIYLYLEARVMGFAIDPRVMKLAQLGARRHIRRQISDPALRAKVTPDYTLGCKRVLISDDYYPALAQPNVEVITAGIREVRANAIVDAQGVERPVDCIIFGTGFHAVDPLPPGLIFGRDGLDLTQAWAGGMEAYKGTTVAGFPNLFIIVGPNTGLGHSSMVYMIESQIAYILGALDTMRRERLRALEVRPEAQAGYNRALQRHLGRAIWSVGGCNSWYLDANGRNTALWPGFTFVFRRITRRFDAAQYRAEAAAAVHGGAAPGYAAAP